MAKSLESEDGSLKERALRLRLAEKYISALHDTYAASKVVVLPEQTSSGSSGFTPSTIASGLTLYKQLIGNDGVMPPSSI